MYTPSLSSPPLLLLQDPIFTLLYWFPLHVFETASFKRQGEADQWIFCLYVSLYVKPHLWQCITDKHIILCQKEENPLDKVSSQAGQRPLLAFSRSFGFTNPGTTSPAPLMPRPVNYLHGCQSMVMTLNGCLNINILYIFKANEMNPSSVQWKIIHVISTLLSIWPKWL